MNRLNGFKRGIFMRRVPKVNFKYSAKKLLNYYRQSYLNVLAILQDIAGLPFLNVISWNQQQSYLRQLEFIMDQLNQNNRSWVESEIPKAFKRGAGVAEYVLQDKYKSLEDATRGVEFSMINQSRVNAHVADTYGDLLKATKNTENSIKTLVRDAVSSTIRMRAVQQIGRKTMTNEIVKKLNTAGLSKTLDEEGWVGIVDAAGRRWNLNTYAEMVARTKMSQAHVEGVRTQALERGVDLAVISTHNAPDACRNFEGLVISLNGHTPGYITYEQLRQSNLIFHPNCGHSVSPVRKLELLPPALRKKHDEKMKIATDLLNKANNVR